MDLLSIGVAFLAGLVSFLSPCVLPIMPGFLAYLAGSSLSGAGAKRKEIFFNAFIFVLGFSFVFSLLGVLINSIFSIFSSDTLAWLSRIGGSIIIFFGVYLTGLIKLPFLEREYKLTVGGGFRSRYLEAFVLGAAFAVGWTPCVGAVLGGIITLAATQPGSAFLLLFTYSLGLGIPFLIVAWFIAPAAEWIRKHGAMLKYLNLIFGIVLIGLGWLVISQNLDWLSYL